MIGSPEVNSDQFLPVRLCGQILKKGTDFEIMDRFWSNEGPVQVEVSMHLEPPNMPVILQEGAGSDQKPKKHYPTVQLLKKIKASQSS